MKRIIVFLLSWFSVVATVAAQESNDMQKYLSKGAVPVVGGKVVFADSVSIISGHTPQQINAVARAWVEKLLGNGDKARNRVVSDNGTEVVAAAQMEIVFQKNALSYDKAMMSYVLTLNSTAEKCVLKMDRIKYNYDDGSGYDTILAEDYITDEQAVNKKGTRLYPVTGKFRRKTIDAAEEIFSSFREGLKYYSREGLAQIVKDAPHVMVADTRTQQSAQPVQQVVEVVAEPAAVKAAEPVVQKGQPVTQPVTQPVQQVTLPVQQSGLEGYRKISPEEIGGNFIKMVGKEWMLITAGNAEKFNMMTASWGGIGVLYNRPVAICFINPARYTYSIMEKGDTYTLTFYPDNCRKALEYCGTKSGRDEDKVKGSGLTPVQTENGAMAFSQATLIIECRKLVSQSISLDAINNAQEREKRAMQPMHKMYIGEILNVWVK